MSYFTNQTSEYIGATGIYPLFEYVNTGSNNIYTYSSNFSSEIESLKQKDLSHDGSISSINSTIGTIQGEVAANTTAIAAQATQIATLEATTAANSTAIVANTGAIVDLNLNKVNKSSFNSTGVIYMDVAGNVQLSYDNTCFSQYSVVSGNAMVLTLEDTYKNLPTSISSINTNLNNNYFNKDQLSNIFVTSNSFIPVLSNGLLDPMLKDGRNPINETTSPSVTKTTFNSSYYYYVFTNDGANQTSYNITFNNPSVCDILIVAGGGGGNKGGGGGGQAILYQATSISSGTYNIKVGKGGLANNNGFNSSFNTNIAIGGYAGQNLNGGNYGNGTGAGLGFLNQTYGIGTGGGGGANGNGGNGYVYYDYYNGYVYGTGGDGGYGINHTSYFGTTVGNNGFFSGGGGGYFRNFYNLGSSSDNSGYGGGGNGSYNGIGGAGQANTGGGGGGGFSGGGNGGSGVVIVRVLIDTTPIIVTTNPINILQYNTAQALSLLNNNINNNYLDKNQLSNIFTTSNHINTNFYNKTQIDTNIYTKTQSDTNYYTKSHINTNFYNKSQIDIFNTYRPMTSNNTLKLTGSISELSLMDGGSGYSPNLTNQPLTFTKGGGQNASGTYNTNASGSVSSVSLTNGGILYTSTLVEVKAGTGNAVIVATMGYFDFHNIYSALNIDGKPDIVYERADLAFGTRNPNIINYLESDDGSTFTMATNKYCGLRVKDDRVFLISNSNMVISSFNNNFIGANSNVKLTSYTSDIILTCVNQYGKIKMKSDTIFEKEVSFNGSVSKKIPKYFTTSRIANFDGISCLAFDINLQTNGVSSTTINGYNFRLFKIYFWFINQAPRYQWTPRSYEVTMSSYDANSVSAFDGFGSYSSLDKAYSYQWFLYRQNFSQISFCCPTSLFGSTHINVGYVIEDLLAV